MSSPESSQQSKSPSADWVLTVSEGKVVLPDADLLLGGSYGRVGPDLVVEGGGKKAVIVDYFAQENPPWLFSDSGAHLDGATVRSLAGEAGGWQVAQAGGGSGPDPIGSDQAGAAPGNRSHRHLHGGHGSEDHELEPGGREDHRRRQ